MKVAFLGNHTVGVRTLQAISESATVVAVVAHPPDTEDGARYESVFDFALKQGYPAIRSTGKDPQTHEFISRADPDLIWIADFRYLIPPETFALAPLGAVNLHPSLLPSYRGRASINWAILKGETRLGLTGHFVDSGIDTGDIIEQISYEVHEEQDIGDCLNILYPLYAEITRTILAYFRSGKVPRKCQDHSRASVFPKRRPEDGVIDWTRPARSICNLVRAVAAPYPGAFTTLNGSRVTVWKARVASDADAGSTPGQVTADSSDALLVQCGSGLLQLVRVEGNIPKSALQAGCRLGV